MRIIEARKFNFSMVKPCDYCKSSPALLYCKVDSAFTCIACDAKSHPHYGGGGGGGHERVWMCEVCEQAPAAFTCKADAAALCVACDRDIHSANPLAGRHERVPAESIVMMKPAAAVVMDCCDNDMLSAVTHTHLHDDSSNNKFPVDNCSHDLKSLELLFSDTDDQILDFESYQQQPFSDSVVPVQANFKPIIPAQPQLTAAITHHDDYHFEIDFTISNVNSLSKSYATNTTAASLSHSVSSSSMDVGVVPDGISTILSDPLHKSTASDGNHHMDREARVLRYREKRKNRKFAKTIRYASRKAYAETRPRIKGRFAKRTDSESDLDRIFFLRSLHC